jgi:membrane-bound serine protease (ClpP class)
MVLMAAAAVVGFGGRGASAGAPERPQRDPKPAGCEVPATTQECLDDVDVFEVSGLVDPIVATEIEHAIDRAVADGSQALILQLNSKDAVVSRERMERLATKIADAPIPVAVWVGPSGARGLGLPGQLIGVAAASGMAPGTRIGEFGEPLEVHGQPLTFGDATDDLRNGTLNHTDARTRGVLKLNTQDLGVPALRNMLLALDGLDYKGHTLDTVIEVPAASGKIEQQAATPRFFKLGLLPRLFHTVASVPVAYLLFTIGMALLIFEFFTAGVGIAGVVGAGCLVLGCYGLAALPARGWAVGLLIASMVAFAIDVQVGIPRFWTAIGILLFTAGSVFLYDGLSVSWITLLVGIGGVALTFIVGMPSMVRTRFATPTIGREWMIGSMGAAVGDISPDGVVRIGEGSWRARTNRATPIKSGDQVRVVAIDGVTLEVEPETGGARDYRERRGGSSAAEPEVDSAVERDLVE